ncbi:sensor histidine kinase [Arthrobacter sp. SDTb3-6]|uniref:sensor histidine kinase n=1 Tax=Arthrobacter sp. SDTb3-6 TaxID=2713571 RepID=UPI00159D11B6|nr:histidine kinase [Arthrobacter sp. SDTb3-6]NVM98583.1 sensor histidine kinase [Arthrobacter sp. SDTb3-6]
MHSVYDWFRRHRFAVDLVSMAVLWFVAMPLGMARPGAGPGMAHLTATVVFGTALVVPLAWRRTRTLAAGAFVAAAAILQWALAVQPMPADIAVPIVLYALAAFAPRWASLGGLALAMLGAILLVTRFFANLTSSSLASMPYGAVLVLGIWVLVLFSWTAGDLTRTKRLREQALEDRAHRLEIEAQQERELATGDERARIAREMHDIVAHSLSVIITQADGALYAAAAHPEAAPAALATIAGTGRSSLQEMRRLLGVLRGGADASMRPLPGLSELDELLLGVRAAGLAVSSETTGSARRTLPAGAELTAYRVVQEGLTNVMKHAGPNVQAAVALHWGARGLDVSVRDNGRGASASLADTGGAHDAGTSLPALPASPRSPGGNGLRGMGERVKLYDGTLEAKPLAGGGFGIAAFIPYSEA